MKRKYDLEERLIDFAIVISEVIDSMPNTKLANYLSGQMIRSGTSPALNYGEAQSAESNSDFIHKMKVILKELRETLVSLKLINKKKLSEDESLIKRVLIENNELVSIFVASINTARGNRKK